MMTTPFVMSQEVIQLLKQLQELAARPDRRIPLYEMQKHSQGVVVDSKGAVDGTKGSPFPLDQTLELPFGFKVTFTIEEHPVGWCRHMSMSGPKVNTLPHPSVFAWVMDQLGFGCTLQDAAMNGGVWQEQYDVRGIAMNVVEPITAGDPLSTLQLVI